MPGTSWMMNGPLGTLPVYWRTLLMYRSTADGTAAAASDGIGNVTRSGRSAKLLRHWKPPRRTERVHASDPEIASPICVVLGRAGSERLHDVSKRV